MRTAATDGARDQSEALQIRERSMGVWVPMTALLIARPGEARFGGTRRQRQMGVLADGEGSLTPDPPLILLSRFALGVRTRAV